MFTLNSLVQKAQSFIDTTALQNVKSSDATPSKATLFRLQFRLPDSQTPLQETTAELTLSAPQSSRVSAYKSNTRQEQHEQGHTYVGKLHLSESFLCFSTQPTSFHPSASAQASIAFTGQTQGAGPAGNGFMLPLCAIRRVERLHTPNSLFALAITTWNGFTVPGGKYGNASDAQRLTVQLAGSRQASERFCDGLRKGLRNAVKEVENLKAVIGQCYSEYLLSGTSKADRESAMTAKGIKEPPDAGLGMVFRYPGDAKKLREQSKMRLWREYLRGEWEAIASATGTQLYRQRSKCYPHPTTYISQADSCWPPQPPARGSVGINIRIPVLTTRETKTLSGHTLKILRTRVSSYR